MGSVPNKNLAVAMMMLNIFNAQISCRGSSDILAIALILMILWCVIKHKYITGGALFGLAVHFRIYPIIFGFPLIMYIDRKADESNKSMLKYLNPFRYLTKNRIKFFGVSAVVFFALLALFYKLYGFQFLYETYLYHSIRKDHRHNFAPNAYFEYFNYLDLPQIKYPSRHLGFFAQWILVGLVGIIFHQNLFFSVFI